jgi:hypothetical protein
MHLAAQGERIQHKRRDIRQIAGWLGHTYTVSGRASNRGFQLPQMAAHLPVS